MEHWVICRECGKTHEAGYKGLNDYGQGIYNVVCGEYVDRYTEAEVLHKVERFNEKSDTMTYGDKWF